jgi:hypothetical protein
MNDWPETNPSLILRIKDPQNAVAWNELMAIYRPVIYRLARRKGLLAHIQQPSLFHLPQTVTELLQPLVHRIANSGRTRASTEPEWYNHLIDRARAPLR